MNAHPMTRAVALRIGLAARALPGIDPRRLVRALAAQLGEPLTEQRLDSLTVARLTKALADPDGLDGGGGAECLKRAVHCLWGKEPAGHDLPVPQAYADGDVPGSIRVGVASAGGEAVDGHFGSCPYFLIYQVGPGEIRLIDVRRADVVDAGGDKNAFRAGLIRDCHVLYVHSVGGPAAAKIVRAGVHPVKLPAGRRAPEVLKQLQSIMAGTPPPWLAKIVGTPAERRVRFSSTEEP